MRVPTSMLQYLSNTRSSLASGSYTGRNSSKKVSGFTSSASGSQKLNGVKMSKVYKEIQTSAAGIREKAESLSDLEKKDKNTTGEIKEFVEQYNNMISNMKNTKSSVNNIYVKQLNGYASSHKQQLEAIGISSNKDGSLNIDQDQLEKADLEAIQSVFSGTKSFAGQVSLKSIYVEAGAVSSALEQTNALYGSYNGYGSYNSNNLGYGSNGNYFNSKF